MLATESMKTKETKEGEETQGSGLVDRIAALAKLGAYVHMPNAVGAKRVEVIQTHISVVFLVGGAVFKIKKPLRLPFVDYSTLALRLYFCRAEVDLNRRLASDVYRGIVPITRDAQGQIKLGGEGEIIDYAVEMRRLDEESTLGAGLARHDLPLGTMTAIGRRLADFHRNAARGPAISAYASFDAVATNCRDNFSQTAALGLQAIPTALLDRLSELTEGELCSLRETIESRARRGLACDCHGDLRLDHVYLLPECRPPADLEIIDCVEFNDAFRYGDPVVDLAFLIMDLRYHGFQGEAAELRESYFEATGDREGELLLPLYTAYRASVRGKVEAFRMSESEVPAAKREEATRASLRHFMLALQVLSAAGQGPLLVLVAGLPGSGKSTLAAALAEPSGAALVRSDVVRKGLVGLEPTASAKAAFGEGIYSPEMSRRTYDACLAQARSQLLTGRAVIVDANLRSHAQRRPFAELAHDLGVPFAFLICETTEAEALARLAARNNDASDADAEVYLRARSSWQEPADDLVARVRIIDSSASKRATEAAARAALASLGLDLGNSFEVADG
ncbi:MAG TPA: hypothetical protein ENK31_01900 [Nannocystis exedens]|nr:hypothetical protein [Nannocystis exedens]